MSATKIAAAIDRIAKDRAGWLVDAVATATQNRAFLRGDPEEDKWATEAILLNGEKAIRVGIEKALIAMKIAEMDQ